MEDVRDAVSQRCFQSFAISNNHLLPTTINTSLPTLTVIYEDRTTRRYSGRVGGDEREFFLWVPWRRWSSGGEMELRQSDPIVPLVFPSLVYPPEHGHQRLLNRNEILSDKDWSLGCHRPRGPQDSHGISLSPCLLLSASSH